MSSLVTYEDGAPFPGVIGRTSDESSPAWPTPPRAPEGAPNVVLFVLDDVGFGQLSCFGGLVETPVLDRFADNGLRYTNMHTTALCSPSRGAILTGRNHHSLGLATIAETSTGFPGYNAILPFEKGMLSEMLLPHGYNTFLVGKWHLSPPEHETPAGPYDRWPLGRGFERFYGFLGGDTNQWFPDLVYDNHTIEQPAQPEDGYHLSADLADRAIEFIQDAHVNAPDKPFYLHYCTGAGHAPHHVSAEWADRYKGKFDAGWDEYRRVVHQRQLDMGIIPAGTALSAHDPDVPAWDTLPEDARKVFARMMEVYAGFVSYTDHEFGRVVDFLEEVGELDNTLFLLVSDNGASPEGGPVGSLNEMMFFNGVPESMAENLERIDELGGPNVFNHYAWGWTNAGNTPFRRWKRETYRGGTTDPCIVSWPAKISAHGEIRTQYGHIIDLVPTVLDALGITPPTTIRGVTQAPIEGVSFAHTFNQADAPTRHHTQYFEMFGHRALYHDGWRAVCPWPGPSFTEAAQKGRHYGSPIDAGGVGRHRSQRLGVVRPHRRLRRNHQRGRRTPRQGDRDGRAVVGRGRQVQRDAARRLDAGTAASGASHDRRTTGPVRVLPRRLTRAVLRSTQGLQPPVQHQRRRADPRHRRRRSPGRPRRTGGWLRVLRQGRPAAFRLQLPRPRLLHRHLQHRRTGR